MAGAPPRAPPPTSPLTSSEAATLTASRAASGGPQLTADPFRLTYRRRGLDRSWDHTSQPPSAVAGYGLSAVVVGLARQDRRYIVSDSAQTNPSGPQMGMIKHFRIWLQFRADNRDFREVQNLELLQITNG